MKLIQQRTFRDGGTVHLITDAGSFFVDFRMRTTTPGLITSRYPSEYQEPIDVETRAKVLALIKEILAEDPKNILNDGRIH